MYQPRLFNPTNAEYQAVAEFLNLMQPDSRRTATVESLKENDADWDDNYLNQRYVVEEIRGCEESSFPILVGSVRELFWAYQPGEVHVSFDVHPDYAGHGVEDIFFDYLVEQLAARTPKLERLIIGAMEDKTNRIAFLEMNGFAVRERDARSALTLHDADLSPLAGLEDVALVDGIRIYTLAQVKELVPDWKVHLHRLRNALDQDVPGAGPKMETTLEQFESMFLQDPALDPEAWWIAVDETSIVLSPQAELVSTDAASPNTNAEPACPDAALDSDQGNTNINKDKDHVHRDHLDLEHSPKAAASSENETDHSATSQRFSSNATIGEFIGYSNLWINDETRKRLDTGMTGVLRSHRRRGIATLLKYQAIAYGKRHNSERIVTSNEENNPMLELNVKLGFKPIPGWIRYEKIFQTEQEQQEAPAAQSQRATS